MSRSIPYGKSEGPCLELKGRDARPADLAREVVAFLNADGGELWWGVKETMGQAEGTEPFEDVEERRRDLQNHLIDTIEPSPEIPAEVDLHSVGLETGGSILCIEVKRPGVGRKPFAQFKEQGRRYWRRVGDRVRLMTREEIRGNFSGGAKQEDGIESDLAKSRERVQQEKKPCFWMEVHPIPELDRNSLNIEDERLRDLLVNPVATGNRRSGFTCIHELGRPQITGTGLVLGTEIREQTEIARTGAIVFTTALDNLHWRGEERAIWPLALLEYPVSVLRLAARVVERWGARVSQVLVDFAFVGLHGWTLRAGSPRAPSVHQPNRFEGNDLVPTKPFRFGRVEIVTEPDRCGLRILTEVYQHFGYRGEDIPPEFDPKTGRLMLSG